MLLSTADELGVARVDELALKAILSLGAYKNMASATL
jgi:hypothetical protein